MEKTFLLKNEKGSVVVLALIMLVLLTLLGMAVTRTSNIEVQIASNDNQSVDCLYQAESANHYAIEVSDDWLSNVFLTTASNTANHIIPPFDLDADGIDDLGFDMNDDGTNDANYDIDGDGVNDVRIEIRCIEGTGSYIGTLSIEANNLPVTQHITIPPIGSGYSLKSYEVRNYGLTGTTLNPVNGTGCSAVQLGAYKVFNKYN